MTPTQPPLSLEQLSAIARNYWPLASEFIPSQHTSPERERLQAVWEQKREDLGSWNDFLDQLEQALPDFIVGDIVTTIDASLRCMIYPREDARPPASTWVVVGCVSILAPVYAVYGVSYDFINGKRRNFTVRFEPAPPEMSAPSRVIARAIEQTFGASLLPLDMAQTPVPLFIEGKEPPETRLFHALFTSAPSSIL